MDTWSIYSLILTTGTPRLVHESKGINDLQTGTQDGYLKHVLWKLASDEWQKPSITISQHWFK